MPAVSAKYSSIQSIGIVEEKYNEKRKTRISE
jgi:hypothetical protein